MNAIEQYRTRMKALGCDDEEINERLSFQINYELVRRIRELRQQLETDLKAMTNEELLS